MINMFRPYKCISAVNTNYVLYTFVSFSKLDGRADGAVDSREKLLEFCFDYCYWSVDPTDPHYASQEEVMTLLPKLLCLIAIFSFCPPPKILLPH